MDSQNDQDKATPLFQTTEGREHRATVNSASSDAGRWQQIVSNAVATHILDIIEGLSQCEKWGIIWCQMLAER